MTNTLRGNDSQPTQSYVESEYEENPHQQLLTQKDDEIRKLMGVIERMKKGDSVKSESPIDGRGSIGGNSAAYGLLGKLGTANQSSIMAIQPHAQNSMQSSIPNSYRKLDFSYRELRNDEHLLSEPRNASSNLESSEYQSTPIVKQANKISVSHNQDLIDVKRRIERLMQN